MKFENLMMHSLFLASSIICALIFGAMLHGTPKITPQTAGVQLSASLNIAPSHGTLTADGVLCPPTGRPYARATRT